MNRSAVYGRTKEFIKGKWGTIFAIQLIYTIVTGIISRIFTKVKTAELINDIQFNPDVIMDADYMASLRVVSPIFTWIIAPLLGVFTVAFAYVIVKAVKGEMEISFANIFDVIKEKFLALLVVSVVTSFISSVIMLIFALIPFLFWVGLIVSPIVQYMLAFASYTIVDGDFNGGIEALKESVRATSGYKFSLFLIDLHYVIIPIISFIPIFMGIGMIASGSTSGSSGLLSFGFLIMILGICLALGLSVYIMPAVLVAPAVAYAMVTDDNDIVTVVERMVKTSDGEKTVVTKTVTKTDNNTVVEEKEVVVTEVVPETEQVVSQDIIEDVEVVESQDTTEKTEVEDLEVTDLDEPEKL